MQGGSKGTLLHHHHQVVSTVEVCFDRVCALWEVSYEEKHLPQGYYFYVFTVGDREEEQVVYVGIRETAQSLQNSGTPGHYIALALHHPDLDGLRKRVYFGRANVNIRDTSPSASSSSVRDKITSFQQQPQQIYIKTLPLLPTDKGLLAGSSQ